MVEKIVPFSERERTSWPITLHNEQIPLSSSVSIPKQPKSSRIRDVMIGYLLYESIIHSRNIIYKLAAIDHLN